MRKLSQKFEGLCKSIITSEQKDIKQNKKKFFKIARDIIG